MPSLNILGDTPTGASGVATGIGDFGAAASDLFAASADRAKAGTDRANATLAKISGQADLLKSKGDTLEGTQYGEAATLSDLNARFTEQSTAIQTAQADRALFGVMGTQRADIAASGFGEGGSGGDILRDSASQGALSRAVLGQQGLITEAGYKERGIRHRGPVRHPGGAGRGRVGAELHGRGGGR
jgi:hypothetical protein